MRLDDLKGETGADAASNAFPPASSTRIPQADAIQWVEATAPNMPDSSGRAVKTSISAA